VASLAITSRCGVMKKGDTVLILAGPYERWYREEVAKRPHELINGRYRRYRSKDQAWIDNYSPLNTAIYREWEVKNIDSSGKVQIVRAMTETESLSCVGGDETVTLIVPGAVLAVLEAA